MKNTSVLTGKVDTNALSLSDAFTSYLDDIYFPDAENVLDDDTVDFEFASFLNTYSK